jgi:integrase
MTIRQIPLSKKQGEHIMEAIRALDTVVSPEKLHALEALEEHGLFIPGFTETLRQLHEQQHKYINGESQNLQSVSTIEVTDKFIDHKRAAGLQPRSIGNYRQVLYSLARQYPTLPSSPEEVERFIASKPSDNTRRLIYMILSAFYKFANQRFNVPDIMVSIQKPRVKPKEPESLTREQAKSTLNSIETARERALVYLYLGQGLRLSEALRLDIGDIGKDSLKIKGKERDESMPLLPEIRDALLELANNRSYNEPVFVGQRGRLGIDMAEETIKRLFKRAGVTGVQQSPKIFRSTFASMALAAGCDFYIVKRLLRHSGGWDVTHRHYIHIGNQEQMERLEKYSPIRLLNEHSDKLLEGEGYRFGK